MASIVQDLEKQGYMVFLGQPRTTMTILSAAVV
jgi:hypothetical protein